MFVRAFDFESVYDLELTVPSPKNDELTVWITACFWQ